MLNEISWKINVDISIQISPDFVAEAIFYNMSALVRAMAWCRTGNRNYWNTQRPISQRTDNKVRIKCIYNLCFVQWPTEWKYFLLNWFICLGNKTRVSTKSAHISSLHTVHSRMSAEVPACVRMCPTEYINTYLTYKAALISGRDHSERFCARLVHSLFAQL